MLARPLELARALGALLERAPLVRVVLALVGLWLPFGLPALLLGVPRSAIPSIELCVAVSLLAVAAGEARPLGVACRMAIALLLLERIDRMLLESLMGEAPLLYDQLFMLRHLFVLVSDLWSLRTGLIAIGVLVSVVVSALIVARALRALERAARGVSIAKRGLVLVSIACVGSGLGVDRELRALFFQAPAAADDVRASIVLYGAVRERLRESPYAAHHAVRLTRKPDVYLFVIESYGRLIYSAGPEGDAQRARMRELERTLEQAGFSTVSAFSRAPVMGGRSWLAEASLLTGMRVRHEAVFRHLVEQIDSVPHLVSTLRANGYEGVLLAPSDRVRPGIENVNYYSFDRVVRFDDLGYRGPAVGWGLVPDQYSLEHTHEHVLSSMAKPLLFDFHMVSSHAPWEQIPVLVSDYRVLGHGDGHNELSDGSMLQTRMKRYARKQSFRFLRRGLNRVEGQRDALRRYHAAIDYELAVLARYLPRIERDALIVVIGDHQPPLLLAASQDFAVPVHVLSRDSSLLVPLREAGFQPGLALHGSQREVLRHEGLYSLLVRTLAIAGSQGAPPPYLRRGVRLGE